MCVNPFLEYVFLWTEELNSPQNRNLTLHSTEDIFSPQRVRFGSRSLRWKHSLRLFLWRMWRPSSNGALDQGVWKPVESHLRSGRSLGRESWWVSELRLRSGGTAYRVTSSPRSKISSLHLIQIALDSGPLHLSTPHSLLPQGGKVPSLKGGVNKATCLNFLGELKKCLYKACQTPCLITLWTHILLTGFLNWFSYIW